MKRLIAAAAALLVLVAFTCVASAGDQPAQERKAGDSAAQAQQQAQKQTLEDKIKSVQKRSFMKKGRYELEPTFMVGLNDAFVQEFAPVLTFQYHILEQLAVRGTFAYVFGSKTSNQTYLAKESLAVPDNGSLQYLFYVNAEWSPIYGKFSLFSWKIVHFDLYLTAGIGAGYVNYTGWKLNDNGTTQGVDMSGFHVAPNIGIGERFFIMDWLAVRVELTDTIYNMTLKPRNYIVTDKDGKKSIGEFDQIQNHLMFMIGLSFFFPTSFEQEM